MSNFNSSIGNLTLLYLYSGNNDTCSPLTCLLLDCYGTNDNTNCEYFCDQLSYGSFKSNNYEVQNLCHQMATSKTETNRAVAQTKLNVVLFYIEITTTFGWW